MILENINFESAEDYIYLERYVNCGSPSGFTDKYNTSNQTCPKGPNSSFYLCGVKLPSNIPIQDFGEKTPFFDKWAMLVHPDMINDELFSICTDIDKKAVLVAPTASSRTVKVLDSDGWFLKLNYKGLIGRIDRQLMKKHAVSAIEVSNIIDKAIKKNTLPNVFYFHREVSARVIDLPFNDSFYEWGIVFREPMPSPKNSQIKFLIPAFSLFSKDDNFQMDPTILTQLINKQNKPVNDFLFEDIISPIYRSYFNLLLNCGLQLEAHAQNILFAITKDYQVLGIVSKDAESIDKDLSLMCELGIGNKITTTNYKCLKRGDYNYHIMHSFMFDFKLGEYLINPIIEDAHKNFSFNKQKLIKKIKKFNHSFFKKLPNDFFPLDGKWYSYENIIHDISKKRNYIAKENPRFR